MILPLGILVAFLCGGAFVIGVLELMQWRKP